MDLNAILGSHDLTLAQECARTVVVFAYGLLLVRIAGRRVFGNWSALDIIVSIIVGSSLSRALTGGAPLGGTLAATALLMLLHWLLALAAARSPALSRLIEGSAIALARDGRMVHGACFRHVVSQSDIEEALRQQNVDAVSETKSMTLEPSGKITVRR